jgi:hypothetical protein
MRVFLLVASIASLVTGAAFAQDVAKAAPVTSEAILATNKNTLI